MKKELLIPLLVLSLGGCIGVSDMKENPRKTLVQINGNQITPVQFKKVNWWTQTGDPYLTELIKEILKNNVDVKVAQMNIQKAEYTLAGARNSNLSSIDISGTGARTKLTKVHADTDLDIRDIEMSDTATLGMVGLKAEYTLDFWGKYKALTKRAEYAKLGTELQKNWIENNISFATAELYGKYVLALSQERVAREKVDLAKRVLSFQNILYKNGLGDKNNYLSAETDKNNAEKTLLQVKNSKETIKNSILALNGSLKSESVRAILANIENKGMEFSLNFKIPNYVDSDLVVNRPDIRYYLSLIDGQREYLKSVKADFYPRFSIIGQVQYQALDIDGLGKGNATMLGIGPSLYLPLFNRAQLQKNYKIAGTDLNIFIEQYNASLIKAYLDVNNSLNSLKTAKRNYDMEIKSLQNSKEKLENNRVLYNIGSKSEYEYLSEKNQYLSQELNMIKTEYELYMDYISMMKSVGGYYKEEVK